MDIIYTLAGIMLMIFTCFVTWINWRILRVSEELLDISIDLLDETIQVRKQLTVRTKKTATPIIGIKETK
tara:strand:+ start:281 stop:490 length:210 start_codon:yes stop_codon:yes gene_type:complete